MNLVFSTTLKVGRVSPLRAAIANRRVRRIRDGAHGVTRPTTTPGSWAVSRSGRNRKLPMNRNAELQFGKLTLAKDTCRSGDRRSDQQVQGPNALPIVGIEDCQ